MRPSDKRIIISGLLLGVLTLIVRIDVQAEIHRWWGRYCVSNDTIAIDPCISRLMKFDDSFTWYSIRDILLGLSVCIFIYLVFRKCGDGQIKSIILILAISLSWVPAMWVHNGFFQHTLDAVVAIIIGGGLAYYLIKRNHITVSLTGTAQRHAPPLK